MVNSLPMMVSSLISTPIFFRFSISASIMMSGRRNSGMPYFSTPPATCNASKMVTATPRRPNSPAQATPAGPLPMMAAPLVSVTVAAAVWSHPRPMPASATKRSRRPMATGLSLSPTTQHGDHVLGVAVQGGPDEAAHRFRQSVRQLGHEPPADDPEAAVT